MSTFGPAMERFKDLGYGIRRLLAPNPSLMTGPGTNTYLIGSAEVAVLDPGPAIDSHIEQIIQLADAPVRWILVTHTHPDHSPAANVLAQMTGAQVFGRPAPEGPHQDDTVPLEWFCNDGEFLEDIDEFDMEVFHTPGHASNHVCYLHKESNWLFTGDHIVDGSTVVIDPPDGNMKQYLDSLRRVQKLECDVLAPGHGELIRDPGHVIDWIIEHRLEREAQVVAALAANPGLTLSELVPHVYKDVDQKLYGWAERSLLAHLQKLEEEGRVSQQSSCWVPL